jgi:hypothetical protein
MSQSLRKSPAEIYHVGQNLHGAYNLGSEIAEYTFNMAVWTFGSTLQHELDSVKSRAKNPKAAEQEEQAMRARVLDRWLPKVSDAEPKAKPAHQFADPANRL